MVLNMKYMFSIFQKLQKANAGTVAERGTGFTSAELTENAKKDWRRTKQKHDHNLELP